MRLNSPSERAKLREITQLPTSASGMRIGLFGGSFNPPHEGHKLVSQQVLKRLGLDAVWWLVTPGNPLKEHDQLAPLAQRVYAARDLIELPNVHATGFEADKGFKYTYDTLSFLTSTLPDRKFVWIMGADSLADFHKWDRWRDIAHLLPLAVYVRPGSSRRAPSSRAAQMFKNNRIDENDAKIVPDASAPAWVYLNGFMSSLSSTSLRQKPQTSP